MINYDTKQKAFIKQHKLTLLSIFQKDLDELKDKIIISDDDAVLKAQARYLKDWISQLEFLGKKPQEEDNKQSYI